MKMNINHPALKTSEYSMIQSLSHKLTRIFFSSASLLAGILVAVVIQAVLSSVWDNF